MPENNNSKSEQFAQLLAESSLEDEIDQILIYDRLRNAFSPQEIVTLLMEHVENNGYPEDEKASKTLKRVYELASKDIPFDEAYNGDLLIQEFAPLYDRIGNTALHLSIAFATLEKLGWLVRDVNFGNDLINQIRSLVFDHVGNAQNSFWVLFPYLTIISLEKATSLIKTDSKEVIRTAEILFLKKILDTLATLGKLLLPYLAITIMLGYQIDAETLQRLPGSFGAPDIADIPVGLISIIGMAKVLEQQRYHKTHFMPIIDKLSKAQSNLKLLTPLLITYYAANTFLASPSTRLLEAVSRNPIVQEGKVSPKTPIAFLRSAVQKIKR